MKPKPKKPAAKKKPKVREAVYLWLRVGDKWKKLGRAKPGSFQISQFFVQ
jgi:hypothetical protein